MLRLPDAWIWDFWLADDGERYHLFFLRASRALADPDRRHFRASVGHAISTDLYAWTQVSDALVPADRPAFDDISTWTGSVVRGPDGLWHMYYTGAGSAENGLIQRIGLATSTDLVSWQRHSVAPIVQADARWYEQLGDSTWPDQAWRDPWVFPDADGNGWHMLITARANHGPVDDRGVIGHAHSDDLVHWAVRPPLSAPGAGFGHLEVPQVEFVGGRPVLLFSCLRSELAAYRRENGVTGGTWAATADSLLGPFDIAAAHALTNDDRYSGRLVRDRAGHWRLLAFRNRGGDGQFVGELSDPDPVAWSPTGELSLAAGLSAVPPMSTSRPIAVIGEAIADVFCHPSAPPGTLELRAHPGGSPANTAVALARLGTPTTFLGRLSTGVFGQMLREHLADSGVDLSASVAADGPATLAIAVIDQWAQASYEFHLNGCVDWQWQAEELRGLPTDTVCVHTGSLALAIEPGGSLIEQLLATYRQSGTVSIDPNIRPSIINAAVYQAGIARWSRLAHILRLSDEDLSILAPGTPFQQAAQQWHQAGVRLIVLTSGADGATASLDGEQVTVPAVPVEPIDTIGAGDAFTAGLLHALHEDGHLHNQLTRLRLADVTQAMSFAAEVAARTCAVRGANPPWRNELTDWSASTPRPASTARG